MTPDATARFSPYAPRRERSRPTRTVAVQWLRKMHGWFGLWGATLGLALGISGIWLNHRAVLKLPPVAQQRTETQLALPDPAPATAQALAVWLQGALQWPSPATQVRVEPSRPVPWAAKPASGAAPVAPPLRQPERWTVNFGGPQTMVQVETWVGNRSARVSRTESGVLGTLMNLHKGIGLSAAWILFADTVAGSLILLSLSGVALWLLTHRSRAVGLVILGASVALTVGLSMV